MKNEKLIIAALAGILTIASPLASVATEDGTESNGCEGNSCEGHSEEATEEPAAE